MNQERFKSPINRQIIEEASEWFVELNEGDDDAVTRRQFHAWLSRSPEHVRAYLKILPVWERGQRLDGHSNGDPEWLVTEAKSSQNVIDLTASVAKASSDTNTFSRRPVTPLYGIAATFAIAVSLFTWFAMTRGVYDTDVGEQRVVELADGSRMELNSSSRIKERFSDQERTIELLEGQALFTVAKDPTRPFVVRSGNTSVRAIGTQFDVYRKKTGTIVTVVEGKVAVVPASGVLKPQNAQPTHFDHPGTPDAGTVFLSAGQQLAVTPVASAKPTAANVNVSVATAWTQQQLVFFGTPLTEVAEEFNRYNKRQLIVTDEGLKSFEVSGTFLLTDPESLIRFLRDQSELKVEEKDGEVVIGASTIFP